jgi:hypothetical protein
MSDAVSFRDAWNPCNRECKSHLWQRRRFLVATVQLAQWLDVGSWVTTP